MASAWSRFFLEHGRKLRDLFDCSGQLSANVVAAMDLRPALADESGAADGHGFAVINTEGRVLFHSDETRNLRRKLFRRVRATILVCAPRCMAGRPTSSTRTTSSGCTICASTVAGPAVVAGGVSRGSAAANGARGNGAVAGFWFLMYAGLLLLCFGVLRFIGGPRVMRWLWPHRKCRRAYH